MADNKKTSSIRFERSSDDPRIGILHVQIPTAPSNPPPPLSLDEAVEYAIGAMKGGPADDLMRAFDKIDEDAGGAYRTVLEAATYCERVSDVFREALHLAWTVSGFRHRAFIKNDDMIIRAFRRVFPPYNGSSLVLYRGERSGEIDAGRIGLNWSADQEVARMFASGLCTTEGCYGVLLKATVEPSAIITGPNHHSANWLCEMEHIIDPRMLFEFEELDRFPPSN